MPATMTVWYRDLSLLCLCRQTRKFMQRWIKPGVKLIDMCELLEDTARNMVEANGLKSGEEYTRLAETI